MRNYFLFLLLACCLHGKTQKPALDTSAFRAWPSVGGSQLTADGNYVWYEIYNQPVGSRYLVVQSTNNPWKKLFIDAGNAVFSNDCKHVMFKMGADSLRLLTLGKDELTDIPDAAEPVLSGEDSESNFLVYRISYDPTTVIVRNLSGNKQQRFYSVDKYHFFDHGKNLLLLTREKKDSILRTEIALINLSSGIRRLIWFSESSEKKPGRFFIDTENQELAFFVETEKDHHFDSELWYYREGLDMAKKLLSDGASEIPSGMKMDAQFELNFNHDGDRIFFGMKKEESLPKSKAVNVHVWSYLDKLLQPLQEENAIQRPSYLSVVSISDQHVIVLEGKDETVVSRNNNFILLKRDLRSYYAGFESYWNRQAEVSYWLVSVADGSRKLLRDHLTNDHESLAMSPDGKWILYYNFQKRNYYSYEIASGIFRNITHGIPTDWLDLSNDQLDFKLNWVPGQQTWLKNDEAVLIYDNWDIWQIDPIGRKPPVNLTNAYGKQHNIVFRLSEEGSSISQLSIEGTSEILLTAVNQKSRDRGFYTKKLGISGNPVSGIMGPFVFGVWAGSGFFDHPPIKAKNNGTYLFYRMSSKEAPNYILTRDMVHFISLTNLSPQKKYNWLTTELIHWRTLDGSISEGILYKPENFDPQKRYPIIFEYYEHHSDELNLFFQPANAEDRINIPWYVSHGYLVCAPDIHYKRGAGSGKSAFNSIVSAAKYLAKLPWVDGKRMGIQGHSFGGYETNYIVTHTNLFKAACSASGFADLIGWYGTDIRGSYGKYWCELQQGRLGANPWQTPKKYIEESPIFAADRITTPLLMMANKGDRVVPFAQGVEFFTALRRLGKRVWMLQYENGHHSVEDEDAADYSARMFQFFNHYLKGEPAPTWMTQGIPADKKGIDDGFELDHVIRTPGPGLNSCHTLKKLTE